MKKVNLFIIGAPKSGTTSICAFLSSHAKICFSEPKEAKYFHTDFNVKHRFALSESEYEKCFKRLSAKHEVVAEGTVWYLYSKIAIRNILKYNAHAKFVVMLRNPVDLAYSLHSQLYYGGDEDEKDFVKAWRLQEKRAQGKDIPFHCRDAKSLQYGEIASLGKQVQALLGLVDPKHVKLIIFDDFRKNPQAIYRDILEFVDLEYDGRLKFPATNENRARRSGPLPGLMYIGKMAKEWLGIRHSFGLWRLLRPLVSREERRKQLPRDFRYELQRYFADDMELLSSLIGKDLSAWTHLNLEDDSQ